jgi:4-amino-4-deoxychorismate lyase
MQRGWLLQGNRRLDAWPLQDRACAYGDGLFETVRINREPVLLGYHLDRMMAGCRRLHLSLERSDLESVLSQALHGVRDAVLKIMVSRGSGGRGYAVTPDMTPSVAVMLSELPQWPLANYRDGIAIRVCDTRLAIAPALAGIKHLNRLEQVLGRMEAAPEIYPEMLMEANDGRLIEGTCSNLFMVCDGTLVTPDLSDCGVAGTLRRWLLQAAETEIGAVKETSLTRSDLLASSECFVCNSVFGIWPIRQCGNQEWAVGKITRKLQDCTAPWFSVP